MITKAQQEFRGRLVKRALRRRLKLPTFFQYNKRFYKTRRGLFAAVLRHYDAAEKCGFARDGRFYVERDGERLYALTRYFPGRIEIAF